MNCAHCGKRNSEDRLFCGFCGMPLGTPENRPAGDDLERALFGRPKEEPRRAPEPVADVPEDRPAERPRRVPEPVADVPEERPAERPRRVPEPVADVPEEVPAEKPVRPGPFRPMPGTAPRRLTKAPDPLAKPLLHEPVELRAKHPPVLQRSAAPVKPRNPNTIVPPRPADMNDMFMEDGADFEDDFDFDDGGGYREFKRPGFLARHARGLVSLALLLVTLLIVGYWLSFGEGRFLLAQLGISGNPETYVELGKRAEERGAPHEVAGGYYLKALELNPRERSYAIKAANAFIVAENSGKAATAIEKLIAIEPDDVSAYLTLQSLYPDPAARPVKVQQLLEQGYQRTGDARLRES